MVTSARYQWQLLRAGPLKLDGGGMFGVVPRVVWSRAMPPDEQHRVTVAHNCLLLRRVDDPSDLTLIETGSGDKLDGKMREIFGLTDRTIRDAVTEVARPEDVRRVIVSHLHFDHAGGLTLRTKPGEHADWTDPASGLGVSLTFPNAEVIVQGREWLDATENNALMTRTYYRDHLEPIRDRVKLVQSPAPFDPGTRLRKTDLPRLPAASRLSEVAPGISVLLVPGHTWGQQAILFTDDKDRTIVFTPDVMPTVHHVGAAYSLSYDVEPFTTMVNKRWFLDEAARNDWLLVLDHEPGNPLVRVRTDGKGWYKLVPEVQ